MVDLAAMLVSRVQSSKSTALAFDHPAVGAVSEARLRSTLKALAYPRHFIANKKANREARDWLREDLRCLGYQVELQGTTITSWPARFSRS